MTNVFYTIKLIREIQSVLQEDIGIFVKQDTIKKVLTAFGKVFGDNLIRDGEFRFHGIGSLTTTARRENLNPGLKSEYFESDGRFPRSFRITWRTAKKFRHRVRAEWCPHQNYDEKESLPPQDFVM